MGKKEKSQTEVEIKPFTEEDLLNRELVIKMLKYEDTLINDENFGQKIYKSEFNGKGTSLDPQFIIQRAVLSEFDFDTSDKSLLTYREIFRTYYKSPSDYDKEVLDSVTYMRENKCVYYTSPVIKIGDKIPDVNLYQIDGKTTVSLCKDILKTPFEKTLIMSFSQS